MANNKKLGGYKCSICKDRHKKEEICPYIYQKMINFDKTGKQNFLLGNVFIECLKKDISLYDLLYEVSYISEIFSMRKLGGGTLNAETLIDYCAMELQCSPKQFFVKPSKTIETLMEYISFFSYDTTIYDEDDSVSEYHFIVDGMRHIDSKHAGFEECKIYAKKEKSYTDRWKYSLYLFCPAMIIHGMDDEMHRYDVGQIFGSDRDVLLYEEYDGVLKDAIEECAELDWEEMASIVPVDDTRFDIWFEKLRKATIGNNLSWKVNEAKTFFATSYNGNNVKIHFSKSYKGWVVGGDNEEYLYHQFSIQLNREKAISFKLKFENESCPREKVESLLCLRDSILEHQYEQEHLLSQDILEEKTILFSDVVVVSSSMYCKRKEHSIKPYRGIVTLLTEDNTEIEYSIYVGYCKECDTYTVFDKDYRKMIENGKPLCKVYTYQEYLNVKTHTPFKYKSQSVLAAKGYNVQADSDLSEEQRHNLLTECLDNHIVGVHDLLDFLHWLIKTREPLPKYSNAVAKWKKDMDFVEQYKVDERETVVVNSITVK